MSDAEEALLLACVLPRADPEDGLLAGSRPRGAAVQDWEVTETVGKSGQRHRRVGCSHMDNEGSLIPGSVLRSLPNASQDLPLGQEAPGPHRSWVTP